MHTQDNYGQIDSPPRERHTCPECAKPVVTFGPCDRCWPIYEAQEAEARKRAAR